MQLKKIDPSTVKKGMFVLVETSDNCVEIGIARSNSIQEGLRIFVLTECEFEDLPPIFDPNWLPFFPPCRPDVELTEYPLYIIEDSIVDGLFAEQKKYLEKEKSRAETDYDQAVLRTDEKLAHFEQERDFARSMFNTFNQLESVVKELRMSN